jgi:hypothetical protein
MDNDFQLSLYYDEISENSSNVELGKMIKYSKENLIQNFDFDDEEKSTQLYCICYMNMIGISLLICSICLYFFNIVFEKKELNILNLSINIIISIFLLSTLFRNLSIKNINQKDDVKKIIFYHYSFYYIIALNIYVIYFLCLNYIPRNNKCKNIGMLILAILGIILIGYTYFNYKRREKNYIINKYFNYFSLSLSLSALFSFSFIILINTYMMVFKNSIFIILLTIISIILLTFYNDIIFGCFILLYQVSFLQEKNPYMLYLKINIIITSICIISSFIWNHKKNTNKKDENEEIKKFQNDEEIEEKESFSSYSVSSYDTF